MKMKTAALFLLALLPVLAVASAYGTKPAVGHGTVSLVSSVKVGTTRTADDNTITTFKNTFKLTGPLTGMAVAMERDVNHTRTGVVSFHGLANFTGTVNGKTGSMMINYVGHNNGTFIQGQFVILGGTRGLVGLRGQGTFHGSITAPLSYTIKWHFEPSEPSESEE